MNTEINKRCPNKPLAAVNITDWWSMSNEGCRQWSGNWGVQVVEVAHHARGLGHRRWLGRSIQNKGGRGK